MPYTDGMKKPLALAGIIGFILAASPPPTWSTGGMVASDHALASKAGASLFSKGGNAADAIIAATLAAGVVQPSSSGLGGGGFAVYGRRPNKMKALDFREVAPAAAHPKLYQDSQGEVIPGASTIGGLAVGVPGEPRGLAMLAREAGTLGFEDLAAPAIQLAEEGFITGEFLLKYQASHPMEGLFKNGRPGRGNRIRRPRLAKTLKAWAKSGGEALYTGAIARDLVRSVQVEGGILTRKDLAAYAPQIREPLIGNYRGYIIVTMPPPSSGGAVLLQVLSVLEQRDLAGLGHNSSDHIHLLTEAFQHAFADRAAVMGDPAFSEVPVDAMLSPQRIATIQADFDPDKTHSRDHYGSPFAIPKDGGTHHLSALDSHGLAVALTTTVNTPFGSRVVGEQSGILLNNQMDDFVSKPGVPNTYGLIGRAANSVEAGKKPLSSMTPTVVYKNGEVVLVVGGSGGPFIISSTLQAISNVVDFGMDARAAVSVPRMHHQWVPELLFLDTGIPKDVVTALESKGHQVKSMDFFSAVQLVQAADDGFYAASDPRKGGAPAGSSQ
jgi:gamma-glutamyltranspeptidase/glutathione hydrolase